MRELGLAVMLSCAACINTSTNLCGSLACPGADVCSADQTCVTVDQLAACSGVADGARCMFAGSSGFCHHGACVESLDTCGDGVAKLALDELCDCGSPDLLQVPATGCTGFNSDSPGATCRSNCRPAQCGDGIVDTNELCDDGNNIPGDGCRADCQGRFTKLQTPTGNSLLAVAMIDDTSVYAFGFAGTALHYDGVSWSDLGLGLNGILQTMWVNGPNEIYVAGSDASSSGLLVYFNGSTWARVDTGATGQINGVWASSPSNIYVTTSSPLGAVIRHFNGTTWGSVVIPCTGGPNDVIGTSASNVYVATSQSLCRFDGSTWTVIDMNGVVELEPAAVPGTILALTSPIATIRTWTGSVGGSPTAVPGSVDAFAATGANTVLAVGSSGVVLELEGTTWTHLASPTELPLRSVSARSPTDVFIVGFAGTVLH